MEFFVVPLESENVEIENKEESESERQFSGERDIGFKVAC